MSKYSKDAIAQFQILPWSDSIIVSEKMSYVIGLKNFFNVINDSSSLCSSFCSQLSSPASVGRTEHR